MDFCQQSNVSAFNMLSRLVMAFLPFDCVDHNKLWKILKEMGIADHLTSLLRNLYAGQEATVRIRHGTTDWFKIGKGLSQGCVLTPCLFNLHAEYIMQNAELDQDCWKNSNNLRYVDDTIAMAESKEELESLDEYETGE